MDRVYLDLTFAHGSGLADLLKRLESMESSIFSIKKRRGGKSTKKLSAVWAHARYRGEVRLVQEDGVSSGQIVDKAQGQLTGAFNSWMVRNAKDLVRRVYAEFA